MNESIPVKEVYITKGAHDVMYNHVYASGYEVGGFLLGMPCIIDEDLNRQSGEDGDLVLWIIKSVQGDCISSRAHVTIKPSTYDRAWNEIEKSDINIVIVGWYHTHPDIGIFLSGTDRDNMKLHYRKPYHIAIVIDPIRNERGVFGWKDGSLEDFINIPYNVLKGNDYKKYLY